MGGHRLSREERERQRAEWHANRRRDGGNASAGDDGVELLPVGFESGESARVSADARVHAHDARARNAHTRTRAREAPAPGPETRAVVDDVQADAVAELARRLRPGLCVRIDRMRPHWCAGWLEDYEIELGDMRELYEYLREEYGGQIYRVRVMGTNGAFLHEARIAISGPPRIQGRVINRDQWEGVRAEAAQPRQAPAPAAPVSDAFGGLLAVFLQEQRAAREGTLEAVREMTRQQNEMAKEQRGTTERLLKSIIDNRSEERRSESFVGQVEQLTKGLTAVESLKDFVRDSTPEGNAAPAEDTSLSGLVATAGKQFLANAMIGNLTGAASPPPMPPAPIPPISPAHTNGARAPKTNGKAHGIPEV